MDPEVDPNEARVSTSVWTRWRFTKQAEAIQPLSPLVSVRIGINAKGIKKVFPLDSSSIRTSQILVSPKKQVLSSKLVAEEPEDVIVSNVELNSR